MYNKECQFTLFLEIQKKKAIGVCINPNKKNFKSDLIILAQETTFKTLNSSIYAVNKNCNKDLNITLLEKKTFFNRFSPVSYFKIF